MKGRIVQTKRTAALLLHILHLLFLPSEILTKEVNINVDNGCDITKIFQLTENVKYNVTWRGAPITQWCKMTFRGFDSVNKLKGYTVCVKGVVFEVRDPSFSLKCYKGFDLNYSKKYDYSSQNINYCAPENKYLDIELSARLTSTSFVQLDVSATVTSTAQKYTRESVADTTSFTYLRVIIPVVLAVIISVLGVLVRRRRHQTAYKAPSVLRVTAVQSSHPPPYPGISTHHAEQITTPILGAQSAPPPTYEEVVGRNCISTKPDDERILVGGVPYDESQRVACYSETNEREKDDFFSPEKSEASKTCAGNEETKNKTSDYV